jgi:hypothetical protein
MNTDIQLNHQIVERIVQNPGYLIYDCCGYPLSDCVQTKIRINVTNNLWGRIERIMQVKSQIRDGFVNEN